MRFTFLALGACQSFALRPELSQASVSGRIASVGEMLSKITSASESLVSLKEASAVLAGVVAESGNATDHISDDDAQLLNSVISLVEKSIYSSMDDAHNADVAELNAAIATASSCNADIAHRQGPDGDLGILHQAVEDKQTELNRLQGVVDEKTEVNNTKWEALDAHMQHISNPPVCSGLPHRTMPALDVFFEKSEYVIWYTAQKASYSVLRDEFVAADADLEAAVQAYNVQKAVRDVQYCDWKSELEAACASFDTCFQEASDYYTKELVPRVTADMNTRIEVKKAGDTLIHQIRFLLAEVEDQATPVLDTSRYELVFPELPAKGLCDLSPLDADQWVPVVDCAAIGCVFKAHHDGLADGIIVIGAGTKKWNGCYERVDSPNGPKIEYRHQEHTGSIYQYGGNNEWGEKGEWRIAQRGDYTAYKAPGIKSSTVPVQGWAAGLDTRTPAGMGVAPAPTTHEVFA